MVAIVKPVPMPDEFDSEIYEPLTEANFKEGASEEDGVSGRRRIDTTFENTDV